MTERDLTSQSRTGLSRVEWEQLHGDPDLRADLGYDPLDLEVFEVAGNDQFMILPRDEDMVREDAFIIADVCSLFDVDECR